MSLIISNRATDKQIEQLKKLEYCGNWNLTVEQAAHLIDELFEQQRQEEEFNQDYMGVDPWGN